MANPPTPSEIQGLWTTSRARFVQSRNRIRASRRWLSQQVEPQVPVEFQSQADMRVKLPYAITTSLHTVGLMARTRPLFKRLPLGAGFAPQQRAERVQQWSNATLTQLEQQQGPIWKPLVSGLFNQAELAVLCYPMKAHWEQWPGYTGDGGAPLMQYQRDSKDRAPDDPYYTSARQAKGRAFQLDGKRSQAAYDSYRADWKSRRLPLITRVVPAEQCVPLFGPGFRLDGLLIRSDYTEDALKLNGFRWFGGRTEASHPSVARSQYDSVSSLSAVHSLMEVWTPGSVSYFIGPPGATGKDGSVSYGQGPYESTSRVVDDQEYEATIDLDAEFGLKNLLATYTYGAHFPDEEDPDRRGVPFLWPFLSVMQNLQNLATAHMAYAWRWAYAGPLIQPDKDMPPELLMEDGKPRSITLKPMTATVVPGTVASTLPMQAGPDVDKMMNLLMGAWREEGPSPQGQGKGQGDPSGHAQVVSRQMLEDTYTMVMGDADDYSGALGAWRWLGQTMLECGSAVADKFGEGVPVYTSEATDDGFRKKAVTLTAESCEGTWDLEAYYPPTEGENLPYAQLLAEWHLQGLPITARKFLEAGVGDTNPEQSIVESLAEKFLFTTPEGQALLNQEIAAELGDQKEQEAYKYQQQGKVTGDMTPVAATQGLPPPTPQGQGALTGTAPNNPVQSALGGIIAGGIGSGPASNDAQALMGAGAPPA